MPRHVLVVAWWFPPLSGGGVHRPLQFVRHLARRGVRVSVLTGVPARGERLDPGLLAKVPREVRVLRAPRLDPFQAWDWLKRRGGAPQHVAAKDGVNGAAPTSAANGEAAPRWRDLVTEAIALPDRWVPWILPAVARAALALRGDEPDLVFSTSPPHSAHLVAHALAGVFAAPLVLDFRDPWIGNPFRRYAAPMFARADAALEQRVVGAAAQVVVNTPALERQFRARYAGSSLQGRLRTIPNGFDPEAAEGIGQLPAPTGGGSPGFLEIAHFGQLYGLRSGRYLLQALAELKRDAPAAAARVKLVFIGSIDGEAGFRALARELGVDGQVAIAGALPHAEALARQRRSDVLLILGPENREPEVQVPGKLYEYFAAQRPILSLSRRGGAIAEILALAGVPCEQAEPDAPAEIAAAIVRLLDRGAETARAGAATAATDAFRYDRLTDRLADCFADACRGRGALAAAGA